MFVLRQFEDVYSGGCKQDDAVLLGYTGGGGVNAKGPAGGPGALCWFLFFSL